MEKQSLTRLPIHTSVFPQAGKTKLKLEEMAGDSSLAFTDGRAELGSLRVAQKGTTGEEPSESQVTGKVFLAV